MTDLDPGFDYHEAMTLRHRFGLSCSSRDKTFLKLPE